MSDQSDMSALLTRFGVGFKERPHSLSHLPQERQDFEAGFEIKIREGYAKVGGWPYFFALFLFDREGAFVEAKVLE